MSTTNAIFTVKTTTGDVTIRGEKIGDYFVVHTNREKWTISHIFTGYAIAHFYRKEDAVAVATVLKHVDCPWDWDDPATIPEKTQSTCHELFSALSKVIKFSR